MFKLRDKLGREEEEYRKKTVKNDEREQKKAENLSKGIGKTKTSPPRHHTHLVFANPGNVLSAFLAHHIWSKTTCAVGHLRGALHRSIPTQTTVVILPSLLLSSAVFFQLSSPPCWLSPTPFFFDVAMSAPPGNRNAAPPAYRRLISSASKHDVIHHLDRCNNELPVGF